MLDTAIRGSVPTNTERQKDHNRSPELCLHLIRMWRKAPRRCSVTGARNLKQSPKIGKSFCNGWFGHYFSMCRRVGLFDFEESDALR